MIDSHCHLAGQEFSADLPHVIQRAQAAGVSRILCVLAENDADEAAAASRLGELWPATRFATGIHPHNAGAHGNRLPESLKILEDRVRDIHAVAIGEVGLDYHYDFSPRDTQQRVFGEQIALARQLHLPLVIHTREAEDDTFRILEEAGGREVRGVFHCFTGDEAMARRALELGFYVSFAGIVTFPRAESLRDAVRVVPLDRLLVETDAPYLAPTPHRGQRNEPAFVARVVEQLALTRRTSVEEMASTTEANFEALFGEASG
jgi:TatD DNase family protein